MSVDIITGVILLGFLIATIWRPPVAYAAAVTTFALEQWAQASGTFFATNSQILNYVVGITILVGLISASMQGKNIFGSLHPVQYGILALFALAVMSTIWSISPFSTISVLKYAAPYLLTYSVALPLLFNDEEDFRTAIGALLLVSLFVVPALTFGTQIHAWGRTIETATTVVNRYGVESTRLNPLAVATYGAVVILACFTAHLGRSSKLLQVGSWILVPMAMFLIVRSGSRGQFAGTLLAALAMIKFAYPGAKFGRLLVVAIAIVALVAVSYFALSIAGGSRFSLRGGTEVYVNTRLEMCKVVLIEWFNSSPMNLLFGLGSSASFSLIGTYPHVQVVEILVELGFIGLALAGVILALGLYVAMKLLKLTKRDIKQRGVAVAFMSFVLLYLILSFKQGSFLTNYDLYFNLAILGRFSMILTRARTQESLKRRREWMMQWQRAQLGMGGYGSPAQVALQSDQAG